MLFCNFHFLNATSMQETVLETWTGSLSAGSAVAKLARHNQPGSRGKLPTCSNHVTLFLDVSLILPSSGRSVKQKNNSYAIHCIRRNTGKPVRSRWDSFSCTFNISPSLNVIPTRVLWVHNAAEAPLYSVSASCHCTLKSCK